MEPNWYEVLGVASNADAALIRSAYRSLVLALHPDIVRGDPAASARFERVQAAYQVLGDPYKRARYDLSRGDPPARPPEARRAARWLPLLGALLALKGFFGVFFASAGALTPYWLLPGLGRKASLALYVVGSLLVFYGAGLKASRAD